MARVGAAPAVRAAVLATALLFAPGTRTAPAADFACSGFLRMHGLLRRASGACGFAAYNPAIVERARACFEAVGSPSGVRDMSAGAAEFERALSVRSRDALCAILAEKFPMVVRP